MRSKMLRRYLSHDEAQAFYDRFGSKQDRQHWYESPATRDLLRYGGFEEANAIIELSCGTGAFAFLTTATHEVISLALNPSLTTRLRLSLEALSDISSR